MMLAVAVVVGLGFLVASRGVVAQEEEVVTITGKVTACAADCPKGCPCTVTVKQRVDDRVITTVYRVTNDDNGKKLAQEADGKKAEVKGTVSIKEDEKWITVQEYKVIEEEE